MAPVVRCQLQNTRATTGSIPSWSDRAQYYASLANPALHWLSLDEAVDDSAVGKLMCTTQAKFEEMAINHKVSGCQVLFRSDLS